MSLLETWRDKVATIGRTLIPYSEEYVPVWIGDSDYLLMTHELVEELLGHSLPYDAIGLPFMAGPFLVEIVDLDDEVVLVRRLESPNYLLREISPSVL